MFEEGGDVARGEVAVLAVADHERAVLTGGDDAIVPAGDDADREASLQAVDH
jgi:hypothetical protein